MSNDKFAAMVAEHEGGNLFLGTMASLARELDWLEERFTYWGTLPENSPERRWEPVIRAATLLETLRKALEADA
jgi:hypothetical protein